MVASETILVVLLMALLLVTLMRKMMTWDLRQRLLLGAATAGNSHWRTCSPQPFYILPPTKYTGCEYKMNPSEYRMERGSVEFSSKDEKVFQRRFNEGTKKVLRRYYEGPTKDERRMNEGSTKDERRINEQPSNNQRSGTKRECYTYEKLVTDSLRLPTLLTLSFLERARTGLL